MNTHCLLRNWSWRDQNKNTSSRHMNPPIKENKGFMKANTTSTRTTDHTSEWTRATISAIDCSVRTANACWIHDWSSDQRKENCSIPISKQSWLLLYLRPSSIAYHTWASLKAKPVCLPDHYGFQNHHPRAQSREASSKNTKLSTLCTSDSAASTRNVRHMLNGQVITENNHVSQRPTMCTH